MKRVTNFLVLLIIIVYSLHFSVTTADAKEKKKYSEKKMAKTVVIPAILPLTGPSADLGQSVANGMRLAVEDMNAKYPGYRFELSIDDSKGQPKEAVTLFHAFMTKNPSPVVLSWMSSAAKALAPLALSNNKVLFMGAAMPELTDGRDFVVRVFPNAIVLADKLATFAASKYNTASILYINDDYGKALKDAFEKKFAAKGKTVNFVDSLNIGLTDFRTLLFKVKDKQSDVLYIPAYGPTYTSIMKQLKEILPDVPIIADIPFCNSYTLEQIGSLSDGVYVPATIVDDEKSLNSDTIKFSKKYREQFSERADFNAGLGYDMARVAMTAIINTDGSSVKVLKYIKSLKNYSGVTGAVSFDKNGDIQMPIEVMQIKNKKPTRLQ